jgi:hypothetical protein
MWWFQDAPEFKSGTYQIATRGLYQWGLYYQSGALTIKVIENPEG